MTESTFEDLYADSIRVLTAYVAEAQTPAEKSEANHRLRNTEINKKYLRYNIVELKAPYHICPICGTIELANYVPSTRNAIRESGLCFYCHLWTEEAKKPRKPNEYIIEGHVYADCGRKSEGKGFLGFGGREFKIRRLDTGTIISTNNLWSGGDIPHPFTNAFPDNAEFVK